MRWPPNVPVWRVTETIGSGIGLSASLGGGCGWLKTGAERARAATASKGFFMKGAMARAPDESKRWSSALEARKSRRRQCRFRRPDRVHEHDGENDGGRSGVNRSLGAAESAARTGPE